MTSDQGNKIAAEEGWFYGLEKIHRQVNLAPEKGARMKSWMFKLILQKVQEARRELHRLDAVIQRMEAAAKAGTMEKPREGLNFQSSDIVRLRQEIKALHGWTVSLLESDISLLMAIENPTVAAESVKGLQRSFAELWALRVQAGFKMLKDFPEVFERVVRY